MLSEESAKQLRSLTNDQLRAIKIRTSEAKIGTHDHQLFGFVDRLLREREKVTVFRTL